MNFTPQDARAAVTRILAQVDQEHEAAYAVIAKAVRICIEAGMDRKKTAQFLGLRIRRINRAGQYVRTPRAVRNLLRSAFTVHDYSQEPTDRDIADNAWRN